MPIIYAHEALETRTTEWQPAVDVYRCDVGWVIKVDLSGVRPGDVRVLVRDGRLVIAGQRRDWMTEAGWQHYTLEITYNRFRRSIELPCQLEDASVHTEYRHGMLIVRLSLKESAHGDS